MKVSKKKDAFQYQFPGAHYKEENDYKHGTCGSYAANKDIQFNWNKKKRQFTEV